MENRVNVLLASQLRERARELECEQIWAGDTSEANKEMMRFIRSERIATLFDLSAVLIASVKEAEEEIEWEYSKEQREEDLKGAQLLFNNKGVNK